MRSIIPIAAISILIVVAAFFLVPRNPDVDRIRVGEVELNVLIADSYAEQVQGLSGTEVDTLEADGMLFVYETEKERTFWMHQMNYNLDMVWIRGAEVVKIEENIPAPKEGENPMRFHSMPFAIDAALELPAGGVEQFGIEVGQMIDK